MTRLTDVRKLDCISVLLLAAAFASFSAAVMLAVRPVAAAIPDHLLDRVRGANNGQNRTSLGSCSAINATPPAVAFTACTQVNQTCITCAQEASYKAGGGAGNFDVNNPNNVNCNPNGNGNTGTCTLVNGMLQCNGGGQYNCTVNATQFPTQPQGP